MRTLLLAWFAAACAPQDEGHCVNTFYADADGDGHGVPDATVTGCTAPPGYETTHDDCDDRNSTIHPGADERCNGIDDDCDGDVDADAVDFVTSYADADGDGFGTDSTGTASCEVPADRAVVEGDCDDADSEIHPGAAETCNGLDDDCNGEVDVDAWDYVISYADADDDGFGTDSTEAGGCGVSADRAAVGGDCDDAESQIHPGVAETCNGIDDDCDGDVDDHPIDIPWYVDADEDGYGGAGPGTSGCDVPGGAVLVGGDCDDHDENVRPDALERCNGVDDDCDGLLDIDDPTLIDGTTYWPDADGDLYGDEASKEAFGCPDAASARNNTDCDDSSSTIHPGAADDCDALDNDCDGIDGDASGGVYVTYYADADEDGFGDDSLGFVWSCAEPLGYTTTNSRDCADDDPESHPHAIEWCDGIDNDCNGTVDDDTLYADWYADADGDGYGGLDAKPVWDCKPLAGYTMATGDCDDGDATRSPGALELCDSIDDDCNGAIDDCQHPLDDADFAMVGPSSTGFSSWGFDVLAADLNADGIADLLAGAPNLDPSLYVAFGPGSGESPADGMDLTFSIGRADSGLGNALAASDADGDGDDDLLLGVPGEHGAYLFLGPVTSGGDLSLADTAFSGPDEPVGLVARIVADHDGDGASDVVISATGTSSRTGIVYVTTATADGSIDLETEATYTYEGPGWDELGASVAALGDTNGDGIEDLAFGAPGLATNAVFVFAGGEAAGVYTVSDACASIASPRPRGFGTSIDATDFDGDGYGDLFVGDPKSAPTVYGFLGPFADERDTDDAQVQWMGEEGLGFSVAAGGDVDADGEADVLLGAYSIDVPHGGAFLQLGAAEGTIDVTDLPAFQPSADTVAGYSVTFVPDWTGDGGSEVAIGAPFMSLQMSPTTGSGRVEVVFSERLY